MVNREERVEIFEDTRKQYSTNKILLDAIAFSKQHQEVICRSVPQGTTPRYDEPVKVKVTKNRSLKAAEAYKGKKICVLNFASATNPGGGVERGSNAQEEAICRCSTLFPCISDEVVVNQFHNAHKEALKRKKLSSLYNDDCIYTPDVVVFKSDTQSPTLMSEKDWYKVDVISCAAPNLRNLPTNERDPRSGMKSFKIKNQILLDIHKKRFPQILAIAKDKGAEVLILGAFGCGAFQNPPAVVSNALYHVIIEHQYDFKEIELAIYCSEYETKNYDAFQKCFCTFGKY